MTDSKEEAMKSYLIESLASLVFRSGKPFGSQASAQDVSFPLPSAGAGLVRYLRLSQSNYEQVLNLSKKDFNHPKYQEILSIQSQGPFLVRYSDENDIEILVPKPANALYFENKQTGKKELVRLEPKAFEQEGELCGSDLLPGLLHVEKPFTSKSIEKVASFWTLEDFIVWQNGTDLEFEQVKNNGLDYIPIELRTHVAIDDDSLMSVDGMLFQTASYDLAHQKAEKGWDKKRLGFLVQTRQDLEQDLATFGGERRLSHFKQVNLGKNISLPFEPTQADVDKINQVKGFSLSFITPCIFAKGALPNWIDEIILMDKITLVGELLDTQIKVQLRAMAIDRWQAVSGWDSLLWKPKATRKAIPAGSVYWFKIVEGQFDLETLQQLSNYIWSDHQQDKYDGFGSAVLSAWTTI